MIIGIGVDILEKNRIKKILIKYKIKFLKKILNKKELSILTNNITPIEFISKKFTIKETISKVLGTGFRNKLTFNKININNNNLGKPKNIIFQNIRLFITISHEKNITISITIIIKTKNQQT